MLPYGKIKNKQKQKQNNKKVKHNKTNRKTFKGLLFSCGKVNQILGFYNTPGPMFMAGCIQLLPSNRNFPSQDSTVHVANTEARANSFLWLVL